MLIGDAVSAAYFGPAAEDLMPWLLVYLLLKDLL